MHHLIQGPEMAATDSILIHISIALQHVRYKTDYIITLYAAVWLHHHHTCLHSTFSTRHKIIIHTETIHLRLQVLKLKKL